LKYGLREFNATPDAILDGVADILEFLATLPTPGEIIALRHPPSFRHASKSFLKNSKPVV
jgi:hypothetical protein